MADPCPFADRRVCAALSRVIPDVLALLVVPGFLLALAGLVLLAARRDARRDARHARRSRRGGRHCRLLVVGR
jgi:hypothetical protein